MSSAMRAMPSTLRTSRGQASPHSRGPPPIWRANRAGDGYGETAEPDWREVDWPAHIHKVEIDGRMANYADLGSGDATPAVFVHGLGGQWQNWLENVPRAAVDRRVIAVDLPGFGLSEPLRDKVTMPAFGDFVNKLLDGSASAPSI